MASDLPEDPFVHPEIHEVSQAVSQTVTYNDQPVKNGFLVGLGFEDVGGWNIPLAFMAFRALAPRFLTLLRFYNIHKLNFLFKNGQDAQLPPTQGELCRFLSTAQGHFSMVRAGRFFAKALNKCRFY